METSDHYKNGATPKSQTSRDNFNNNKMKAKKAIGLAAVCLIILSCMAFVNKTSTLPASDEQFIYIIAYAGTQNNSMDNYVSGMINYNGYDACSKEFITSADFFASAGRKFLNYLESKYGLNKNDWKLQYAGKGSMVDYPSGYFKGFETKSEAQKAKDEYLRKDSRGTLYDNDFTYRCLGSNASPTETKSMQKSEGKAWWCSYYIKDDKIVYITKVYNNDCNHCQNEIATAFAKWLILNDYDNQATTLHINSISDVTKSNLEERREEYIIGRKQKNYTVINVEFTYTEK